MRQVLRRYRRRLEYVESSMVLRRLDGTDQVLRVHVPRERLPEYLDATRPVEDQPPRP